MRPFTTLHVYARKPTRCPLAKDNQPDVDGYERRKHVQTCILIKLNPVHWAVKSVDCSYNNVSNGVENFSLSSLLYHYYRRAP